VSGDTASPAPPSGHPNPLDCNGPSSRMGSSPDWASQGDRPTFGSFIRQGERSLSEEHLLFPNHQVSPPPSPPSPLAQMGEVWQMFGLPRIGMVCSLAFITTQSHGKGLQLFGLSRIGMVCSLTFISLE